MNKKSIQQKRMIRYFVEAVWSIIDTEGLQAVNARKVATKAGYNVATLYNYFENLNHLIFFSSIRYLRAYATELPNVTKDVSDPIIMYMKVCQCFNSYAMHDPGAYKLIFFGDFQSQYNNSLELYYEVFPEELPKDGLQFFPMLQSDNIHERDYRLLLSAANKYDLDPDTVKKISLGSILIMKGMLDELLSSSNARTPEETAKITTSLQAHLLIGYGIQPEVLKDFI